jgi:hypothetical protein
MADKLKLSDIFDDRESHKTILKIGIVMFLLMELIIYLVANAHSGTKSWVEVYNSKGDMVYETQGNVLTTYEKLVFQNTYGPLSNYNVKVVTRTSAFPFRAWLAVAVGAPIGFMLLLTYLVRAYLLFVSGAEEETAHEQASLEDRSDRFGRLFQWRRLSLFHLGFFIVICVLALWLIPDYVAEIARGALGLVLQYKWFFLGVFVFISSLFVWIIYLKYKISQKMMDRQMDLEKFKIEKQLLLEQESRLALPGAASSPAEKAEPHNDSAEAEDSTGSEGETLSDGVSQK